MRKKQLLTLSTTAGYAIQALSCMAARPDVSVMIQTVARETNVPAPYLAKIVKKLNKAGLVSSRRGARGGIWLARPAAEITLLDVMHAVDGVEYLSGCLLGNARCSDARSCPMHTYWKQERAEIRRQLKHHTLAEVVAFYARAGARTRRAAGAKAV